MIFQETTRTRRLAGRVEAGEDPVDALTDLCREHGVTAGEVRGLGTLDQIELVRFNPDSRDYEVVFDGEGSFDLISLTGNISRLGDQVVVRLEVLASVVGPFGPQVITGQLRSGRAVSCDIVLDVFEDLAFERGVDAATGRLELKTIARTRTAAQPTAADTAAAADTAEAVRAEPTPEQKPISGKAMSWKDAVAESQQATETASDRAGKAAGDGKSRDQRAKEIYGDLLESGPEEEMKPGDILDHPKLGRCRVMKVAEGDFVHVRLPRGKIRKLSLDIVDVEYSGEENGRNVFKARIGK